MHRLGRACRRCIAVPASAATMSTGAATARRRGPPSAFFADFDATITVGDTTALLPLLAEAAAPSGGAKPAIFKEKEREYFAELGRTASSSASASASASAAEDPEALVEGQPDLAGLAAHLEELDAASGASIDRVSKSGCLAGIPNDPAAVAMLVATLGNACTPVHHWPPRTTDRSPARPSLHQRHVSCSPSVLTNQPSRRSRTCPDPGVQPQVRPGCLDALRLAADRCAEVGIISVGWCPALIGATVAPAWPGGRFDLWSNAVSTEDGVISVRVPGAAMKATIISEHRRAHNTTTATATTTTRHYVKAGSNELGHLQVQLKEEGRAANDPRVVVCASDAGLDAVLSGQIVYGGNFDIILGG